MGKWQWIAGVVIAALAGMPTVRAESPPVDPHFATASLSAICHGSAFLHGYLHGYEEAFQTANLRLYVPQYVFNPPKLEGRDGKAYRSDFGNEKFFRAGYRQGFLSGYADGMSGGRFRALKLIRDSFDMHDIPASLGSDRGLALGYFAGRERGLRDGRLREPFQPPGSACNQAAGEAPNFCKGLVQGFRMGYLDGYQNQYTVPAAETASR